jgi:hypothetical protein
VSHASVDFSKIQIKANISTTCHHKNADLRKDCSRCHPVQNNTYNGNILGEKLDPDIMNSGGVKCEDCHLPDKKIVSKPSENFCSDCHDASYKSMKVDWTNEIKDTISSLIRSIVSDKLRDNEHEKFPVPKNWLQ